MNNKLKSKQKFLIKKTTNERFHVLHLAPLFPFYARSVACLEFQGCYQQSGRQRFPQSGEERKSWTKTEREREVSFLRRQKRVPFETTASSKSTAEEELRKQINSETKSTFESGVGIFNYQI
jgi:hypothetical protein